MSAENGKVCCNCRHNKRYHDEGGMCYCECEISKKWLSYIQVMEGWCKHWAKERNNNMHITDKELQKHIKSIGYKGCNNCKHQIAPLRMCKWAEQGGDGQIHFLCPKWDKAESEVRDADCN